MDDVTFLTLDDVLEIHDDQLKRYGGASGIIDEGVVHAVTFAPQKHVTREQVGEWIRNRLRPMA